MKRRVVITGIGPVTAIGIGKNEFFNNILDLKTHILKIPEPYEKNYIFKSRYFVPKPDFSLVDIGVSKSFEDMKEEATKISVLCAYLALNDAGFKINKTNKNFQVENIKKCNVIIGMGMSSLQTALESYTAHISDKSILDQKKARYNRLVIPMLMPNSASAWLSILFGIKGLNYTLNASCASGTIAIGEAYKSILNNSCDMAITGGVEALSEKNGSIMRGFDMLSTLTRSEDGRPNPFCTDRSGFLFNEGAGCVLILEELQSALKRKANIYAEITQYESSSDAYNIIQMEPSGENIEALFKKVTKKNKIDYINAHGTATLLNDEIEAKVIQNVFGDKNSQPLINSTKGIIGHSIGASGAIEAATVAMSIKNSKIHGNLLSKNLIENLNITHSSIEREIEHAISASYGFGGHNAVILFKRFKKIYE